MSRAPIEPCGKMTMGINAASRSMAGPPGSVQNIPRLTSQAEDSILAENEVEILNMALAWLNYKPTRHIFIKQVFSCVRFYLMTPTQLAHIDTHIPEIKEFLYQAYKYHALKQNKCNNPLMKSFKLKSRNYFSSKNQKDIEPKIMCLSDAWCQKKCKSNQRQHAGGTIEKKTTEKKNYCDSKNCLHSIECSINKKGNNELATSACCNHMALKPSITKSINNPTDIVGIQQDIFVFGGTDLQCFDTDLPGRQVLRLSKNVGIKKWEPISTLMPVARTNHCAVSIGTVVYIIGGAVPIRETEDNFAQPSNTTIAFDTESCEWIACSSMYQARIYFTAAAWKGRIFVFGGQGIGNSVLNAVESFDPVFDKWTKCCPLPSGRVVESFDPVFDKWTKCCPLPSGRVGCCAHEFQDKIFVIGGYAWINGNPTALYDVYTYSPFSDSYCQLSNLSRGLCYASLTTTAENIITDNR
uniref:BACK domain-containing protein n=1 Tax=Strigamia maritima TaxID=126957 RepID=T1IT90_STRMM